MILLLPSLLLGATLVADNPISTLNLRTPDLRVDSIITDPEFAFGTEPNSFASNHQDCDGKSTFGDSYTDSGRGFELSGGASSPGIYFNHAYSNGPVYPVLLSERLGVDLLGCAIGGATSNNSRALGNIDGLPVDSAIDQVEFYLGALGDGEQIDDRLHILYIGLNNIKFNSNATGPETVEDVHYVVKKLLDAGANHILLLNLQNIGQNTPYVLKDPSVASFLTNWASTYRDAMYAYWPPLGASDEHPSVAVVDVFSLVSIIDRSYEQFGLKESTKGVPCLGLDPKTNETTVWEDADQRAYWDEWHPSARVHSLLAAGAMAALKAKGWAWRV